MMDDSKSTPTVAVFAAPNFLGVLDNPEVRYSGWMSAVGLCLFTLFLFANK